MTFNSRKVRVHVFEALGDLTTPACGSLVSQINVMNFKYNFLPHRTLLGGYLDWCGVDLRARRGEMVPRNVSRLFEFRLYIIIEDLYPNQVIYKVFCGYLTFDIVHLAC